MKVCIHFLNDNGSPSNVEHRVKNMIETQLKTFGWGKWIIYYLYKSDHWVEMHSFCTRLLPGPLGGMTLTKYKKEKSFHLFKRFRVSHKIVTDKFPFVNLPHSAFFSQLLPTANSCLQMNKKRSKVLTSWKGRRYVRRWETA